MNLFTEIFAKYSCTNCQDEIVGVTVHCSECVDFSLCLQVSVFNVCIIIYMYTLYALCLVLQVRFLNKYIKTFTV